MASKKRNERSTSGPKVRKPKGDAARNAKMSPAARSAPTPTDEAEPPPNVKKKGLHGVPGSKDDSRRCTATANRTGERCRAAAIKGGNVCRIHGGAAPQVKKAAKERLLELVDPALAVLHKVLTDPESDDAVKVRSALGILDRAGFRPGVVIEVEQGKWFDALEAGVAMTDNRSLGGGAVRGEVAARELAGEQLALDANTEAWREYDAEDAEPYNGPSRIEADENTVRGEVVRDGRSPAGNSDYGRHPLDWQERQRGPGQSEMDPSPSGPYEHPALTEEERLLKGEQYRRDP